MLALADTQRAIATVAVFLAIFLITLSIGRLLKRRAGVRFGVFFQLFALAASFYAAAWVYGLEISWRNHLGAAVALLSTAVVIALVDRYLWDTYFEKGRAIPVPKALRDLVATVIFLIVLMLVLSFGYHAENQLKGLLAGSGVLAIILGFAAQNLLSSLVAGLSLQIQRPYKVGDWLKVGDTYGEVLEIRWGATRLRTNDAIMLHIPNNEMVKQTIVNLTYPTRAHYMRLFMSAEYGAPPNRVKDALMRATVQAPGVEKHPPPQIFVSEYGESAIIYQIKFTMTTHSGYFETRDAIYTNIWYEFRRQKITIPFPIRTLEVNRHQRSTPQEELARIKASLESDSLFSCLSGAQLEHLIRGSRRVRFGRGERIIEEGMDGESMFVLLQGAARVCVSKNGAMLEVASLGSGDYFGEMSLLTGEKRTATVQAEEDCEVIEISKSAMGAVLHEAPDALNRLSELLAARKMETEGVLKDAPTSLEENKKREYRATFLQRLRKVFEL